MKTVKTIFLALAVFSAAVLQGALPKLNIDEFGAGPGSGKGKCYYVAPDGSDSNDGSSRSKAFKSIKYGASKLTTGDTLYVAGGKYYEFDISLNCRDEVIGYQKQSGKPGSPVSIVGIPGENPVIIGSKYYQPVSQNGQVAEFKVDQLPYLNKVQEYPSRVELQVVNNPEVVKKYPGTFFVDEKNKTLLVHYAASEQTGIYCVMGRIGLRTCGSYIHIENLTFEGFTQAMYLRRNRPYDKNIASNVTVKNCNFYYNFTQGICMDGVEKSLVTGCRFAGGGYRGGLLILPRAHDNLIYGNWGGDMAMTLRQFKPYDVNYAFNQYGYTAGPRNHFIGNVMDNNLAFRWKDDSRESLFISNILYGSFSVQGPVKLKKHTIVNNVFGGKINWVGVAYNAWEKDFADTPIFFKDNVKDRKDFKPLYPVVLEAEKLAVKLPKPKFPKVVVENLQIKNVEADSAVISWKTPEADGFGRIAYKRKGEKNNQYVTSSDQGSEHLIVLNKLQPDTEYEIRTVLLNRRGKNFFGKPKTFRTAKTTRQPMVLEVGPGKMSLKEACAVAIAGDTINIAPGRYIGNISLQRSGQPGKPITVKGNGAILDAACFYAPMLDISNQSHIIIDGIVFVNPEITARKGIIYANRTSNVIIRNCRGGIDTALDWRSGGFVMARFCNDFTLENNIIWGCDYPLTFYGKNLTVKNNTIVKSAMMSLLIYETENIRIENNIFYRQCVDQKTNQALFFNGKCSNIVSDGNVFYSPLKTHPIGGRFRDMSGKVLKESPTLKDWQKISGGLDMHSIHADPMFVDVKKGDFNFKPGSPAAGKGASIKF